MLIKDQKSTGCEANRGATWCQQHLGATTTRCSQVLPWSTKNMNNFYGNESSGFEILDRNNSKPTPKFVPTNHKLFADQLGYQTKYFGTRSVRSSNYMEFHYPPYFKSLQCASDSTTAIPKSCFVSIFGFDFRFI